MITSQENWKLWLSHTSFPMLCELYICLLWVLIASLEGLYNLWFFAKAVKAITYFGVELNNKYLYKSTVWLLVPAIWKRANQSRYLRTKDSDFFFVNKPITLNTNNRCVRASLREHPLKFVRFSTVSVSFCPFSCCKMSCHAIFFERDL